MKFITAILTIPFLTSCITTAQSVITKCKEIRYEKQTWMCMYEKRDARPLDPKEQKVLELDTPDATKQISKSGTYYGELYAIQNRLYYSMTTCYRDLINREAQTVKFKITYVVKNSGEVESATLDDSESKIEDGSFKECIMQKARKAKFLQFRTKAETMTLGPLSYEYSWKVH